MAIEGQTTQTGRTPLPTLEFRPSSPNAAAGGQMPALGNHHVRTAEPDGPRNPVVGMWQSVRQALARKFAAVLPCFGRADRTAGAGARTAERAVRNTRRELQTILHHLASGKAQGRVLADDLRRLGAAQRQWQLAAPETQGDMEVATQEAIARIPRERQLELLQTLTRGQLLLSAHATLRANGDGYAERALVRLTAAAACAVRDRGFADLRAAVNGTFEAIRGKVLRTGIAEDAEKAVAMGHKIVQQLRLDGALPPPPGSGTQEERRLAQTGQVLRRCIQDSVMHGHAADEEVDTLLQHLSSEALQTLRETPRPTDPIGTAVEREINERPGRLHTQLRREFADSRSLSVRNRSDTALASNIGSDLNRLAELTDLVLDHSTTFGVKVPAEMYETLNDIEKSVPGSVKELEKANTRSLRVDQLAMARTAVPRFLQEQEAKPFVANVAASARRKLVDLQDHTKDRLGAVLRELGAGTAAGLLAAGKDAVAAARAYRNAHASEGGFSGGSKSLSVGDQVRAWLGPQLARLSPAEVNQLTFSPYAVETRALIQVLAQTAEQASQQELPELYADLKETHELLSALCEGLERSVGVSVQSSSSYAPSVMDLVPETCEALAQLFSTAIQLGGQIKLTAGRCRGQFAGEIVNLVETPFSIHERSSRQMADGTLVPLQFYKDAERAHNTVFFTEDGAPLIDQKGWGSLDTAEKDLRITDGYARLVRFYQGNDTQTRAILTLANQATAATFLGAMKLGANDSPIVFDKLGTGVIVPAGTNFKDLTTASFSTGTNHTPQLRLTYEIRGGRFDPIRDGTPSDEDTMFLDLERSRVKISVLVEAQATEGRLKVVGTPVYDVHLVRSPIQRAFPMPKPEHLADRRYSRELSEALTKFAEQHQFPPPTVNGLQALYLAIRAKTDTQTSDRFGFLRRLYQTHLSPDAPSPIAAESHAEAVTVAQYMGRIESETGHVFDDALQEAMRQIAAKHETPEWKDKLANGGVEQFRLFEDYLQRSGGEAARLSSFVKYVVQFKSNDKRTVDDALALHVGVFGEPGSAAQPNNQAPELGEDLIRQTRRRIEDVIELRNRCFESLQPLIQQLAGTAAALLPDFTQGLLDEANQSSGSVNISDL